MHSRPSISVAVTMRKERLHGAAAKWQDWRWMLDCVSEQVDAFGETPRCLLKNDNEERWLHPAFKVELFKDDAEGYYLNLSSPAPCWFVLWRMEEELCLSDTLIAVPAAVSLSYHDAGRWLDAQEKVDQVPAPADVAHWCSVFTQEHLVQESKKRKRPESFKRLEDRFGNPASISTGKS